MSSGQWALLCAACAYAAGFLALVGCAHRRVAPPSQLPSPDEVIHRIQHVDAVKTLRAWGTAKWRRGEQRETVDVAIILQRPDKLRLEGLSPLGSSIFSLLIQGGKMALFVPSEKRVYEGPASQRTMAHFFALPLKTEEAIGVLSGRVPLCSGRGTRIYMEQDAVILEVTCEAAGLLQRVELDPRRLEPVGFRLQDPLGQDVLVVAWKDFQREGEARVPMEISLEMPKTNHLLRFRMDELEINPPISEERFQLILPQGIEVRPLPS